MPKLRLAVACAVVLVIATAGSSSAAGGLPPDPASNFAPPPSCSTAASCLASAITVLDRARARLGQPAYRLPSDFAALTPAEQTLVLTDLDRLHYGLEPVTGLTADLDAAAAGGVRLDRDPTATIPGLITLTSNWASGYADMPLAYEAWMYDDGPGAGNLDCVTASASGCWAHRHNILWPFTGTGALAMGAAAGVGSGGAPGYAMLIVQGGTAYHPAYLYTWSQAVAAGAGAPPPSVSASEASPARIARAPFRIALLRVRGHSLILRVAALSGLRLRCALTRLIGRARGGRFRRCGARTTYRKLSSGSYRLRVRGGARTLTRSFRVG
ncbi:MAG TPA: hypothetical protein VMD09_14855 [Solirubrobacteraceae bacterium]|nr:hypothetical protein [Solirubrobacteraceae bacterium]